jgi:hypothetical protein
MTQRCGPSADDGNPEPNQRELLPSSAMTLIVLQNFLQATTWCLKGDGEIVADQVR